MLKAIILISQRTMSGATKKTKLTLAKKLSSKVVMPPTEEKIRAERKSELFNDIKNVTTSKSISTNEDKKETGRKSLKKSLSKAAVGSEEKLEDDRKAVANKKPRRIAKTNIAMEEVVEDTEAKPTTTAQAAGTNLKSDILKKKKTSKTSKTSKKGDKKESQEECEPSCSQEIKEEILWQPPNWSQILENIKAMRLKENAPVDSMGCHKCADNNADEKTQRFHKLVALMLSSQTKDETTYHAMLRLREQTLTPESICEMKINVLENILHPVSFYKNKAKYLQQTSKILVERYSSDIPKNIKELIALPGVGPKMAHICMSTAWNEVTGIGVDVHVHRICNRLQWVPKPTKDPEQTRIALERWLPRDLWQLVNHSLVGFGQTICTPLKPKCTECLNCDICPAAPKTSKTKGPLENEQLLNICEKSKFKKTKIHL